MQSKIHKLAAEAFRKFREENIELTVEEIVLLNSLAHDTEKVSDPNLLLYTYKKLGDLKIYPMTLGARIWLLNVALPWFEGDEQLTDLAILYTYANSQNLEALQFETMGKAKKAILKWAKGVKTTEKDILEAFSVDEQTETQLEAEYLLRDVVDQIKSSPTSLNLSKHTRFLKRKDSNKDVEVQDKNWAIPTISFLMHYYPGKTQEQWLWETSEELCMALIEQANKMESTDEAQQIDPNDQSIIAFNKFQKAITHIRSRHHG